MSDPDSLSGLDNQMNLNKNPPTESDMDKIENQPDGLINKPKGGIWTSTMNIDGSSQWLKWAYRERFAFHDRDVYALWVDPEATVFNVDNEESCLRLIEEYGLVPDHVEGKERPLDAFGRNLQNVDFVKLSQDYDGLRFSGDYSINSATYLKFNGWDAESTVWFDWEFECVECLGPTEEYVEEIDLDSELDL